ncbi:DUF2147 domain-containing protein [Flammeovirga sp. SubArs3]|uniref:DUF2147 domain-containing protein n=1 Tax=Flammeovirga sp. SubArs3 TaxID=2995316 RepID=UPI00248C8E88|nr:DUF2147 domain-containing protein [Flammeovirga sp. SubArs3]
MNRTLFLFSLIFAFFINHVNAQESSVFGVWKTIDDETDQAKAYVEIYKDGDKMFGKIIKLLSDPEDSICEKCSDEFKDQKIVGMKIIWDMEQNGDQWIDGKILKPENGKIYNGKIWVENGKLQVRGYLGFMYKTQTWERVE